MKVIIKIIILLVLVNFTKFVYPQANHVFTNLKIRNISNDITNSVIMWSNISIYSQNWMVGKQYIEVDFISNHAVITGWGCQIYSANKTVNANPRYKGASNPAGMIDTFFSNRVLPMAWIIQTNKVQPANPKERSDFSGFSNYSWHFLADTNTVGFTNELDYFIPWNQAGYAWGERNRASKPKKAFIYFAADFLGAFVETYQTTQLRVEEYHDNAAKFLPFYVYYDFGGLNYTDPTNNHYSPASMGGVANFNCITNTHSGTSCIQYLGAGGGGYYFLEPDFVSGWTNKGQGYDLTGASKLTFWVRTDNFGGAPLSDYGLGIASDSCGKIDKGGIVHVPTTWTQIIIPLSGTNLRSVAGGFYFWSGSLVNFYFDSIRYEK